MRPDVNPYSPILALLPHLREEVKTHGLWVYIDGDVEVYFEPFQIADHLGETYYYQPEDIEEILDLLDAIETWAEYDGDPKISPEWVKPEDLVKFRLALAPDCEGFAFRKTYKNHDALVAVALSERNLEELVEAVV